MWPRSHTSGLISAECAVSTSASESGATRLSVRSRASSRAPGVSVATVMGLLSPKASEVLRPARLPPHADDLADRRRAVRDPRVERAHAELEAAGAGLLQLGHEGVEAAALLVDEHDVAGADALRGRAPLWRTCLALRARHRFA